MAFWQTQKRVFKDAKTNILDIETEDICDAIIEMEKGPSVNLHIDYLQKPFQRGIKILGAKGMIVWDMALGEVKQTDNTGKTIFVNRYEGHWEHNQMYVDQQRHFVELLSKPEASYESFISGQKALELAEQMKYSSIENKVVDL